jgi:hypothetical protein
MSQDPATARDYAKMKADQPPVEVIRCPVHGIPDCSPLLNGCSIPNQLAALWRANQVRGHTVAPRYCNACGTAPCRFIHPPLDKNR